jgi:hypothetical protein
MPSVEAMNFYGQNGIKMHEGWKPIQYNNIENIT